MNDIETIAQNVGSLEGKSVLISGGSGFLGRCFLAVFHELNKGYKKPCYVLSIDPQPSNVRDQNIETVIGDVAKEVPDRHFDYIIHAAGFASPYYYDKYPLETIDSAVTGARNLLELAKKYGSKFLLFSTSEIYGDPTIIPTPETYNGNVPTISPRSCYDESKRLAETITGVYANKFGVNMNILRPFNVYGPGMRENDYRVIPMFVLKAKQGQPIPVHGHGRQTRSFCYITDAMIGFLKVLLEGKPGEVYNVGNDEREITILELAEIFVSLAPQASIQLIPTPPGYTAGEPTRRLPDLTKIRALGYEPQVTLVEGIKKCL